MVADGAGAPGDDGDVFLLGFDERRSGGFREIDFAGDDGGDLRGGVFDGGRRDGSFFFFGDIFDAGLIFGSGERFRGGRDDGEDSVDAFFDEV